MESVSCADRRAWAAAVAAVAEDELELLALARVLERGTWWVPAREVTMEPVGLVKGKFLELARHCGVLKKKQKQGVRFMVRSADDLVDKIRPKAMELGLLIYPVRVEGRGHVVEEGTLAEVTLTLRIEAVEDGSFFEISGFGLGADNQDKAGGKAGTYAWKAALVQALLAGGEKDTDDTDTPIPGGVRRRAAAGAAPAPAPTMGDVEAKVAEAVATRSKEPLKAALKLALALPVDLQQDAAAKIKAASVELQGAA